MLLNAPRYRRAQATTTFSVSNSTASETMFTLTGSVHVSALWGVVSTVISSNHTAGFVELYDQTASPDVTVSTGITLSALAVGTLVFKESLTAVALNLKDNAAGAFEEPAAAGTPSFAPFIITKKTGAVTILRYTYTSTNTPATGAILWTALWMPLSNDGFLA